MFHKFWLFEPHFFGPPSFPTIQFSINIHSNLTTPIFPTPLKTPLFFIVKFKRVKLEKRISTIYK